MSNIKNNPTGIFSSDLNYIKLVGPKTVKLFMDKYNVYCINDLENYFEKIIKSNPEKLIVRAIVQFVYFRYGNHKLKSMTVADLRTIFEKYYNVHGALDLYNVSTQYNEYVTGSLTYERKKYERKKSI